MFISAPLLASSVYTVVALEVAPDSSCTEILQGEKSRATGELPAFHLSLFPDVPNLKSRASARLSGAAPGCGMSRWHVAVAMIVLLTAVPAIAGLCSVPVGNDSYEQLDQGYSALYNLEFDSGQRLFMQWAMHEPQNPLGPVSRASGYLFQEFERLGVLKSEIFADDAAFEARRKPSPDRERKLRFQQQLLLADRLADEMLAQNPSSPDALLAKTLMNGLQADYAALIEKRNGASLSYTKEGRRWAERLLHGDASCYDAYLALGAENYLVSSEPVLVRWIARLSGARDDRERGLQQLKLAGQHGRFLKPFAKLLLAVAALRDHDYGMARMLLAELQQEFPRNPLYSDELSRLKAPSSIPHGGG